MTRLPAHNIPSKSNCNTPSNVFAGFGTFFDLPGVLSTSLAKRPYDTHTSFSNAASAKGDTGVGELGLTLRPIKDSGFSMDLGVQGYIGLREGVTGSFQLQYAF